MVNSNGDSVKVEVPKHYTYGDVIGPSGDPELDKRQFAARGEFAHTKSKLFKHTKKGLYLRDIDLFEWNMEQLLEDINSVLPEALKTHSPKDILNQEYQVRCFA